MKIKRAISAAVALTASLLAVAAPAASASEVASAADCTTPSLSASLAGFGDTRSYFLAPGGDFEAGTTGWALAGGARTTLGGGLLSSWRNRRSLVLPAGATATSPTFCVDLNYPTFRFFADQAVAAKAKLSVDVIYPAIAQKKTEAATVSNLADWTLTKDVPLKPAVVDKAGGWRLVQLRFRAAADGPSWKVDDVLVDPRMRG